MIFEGLKDPSVFDVRLFIFCAIIIILLCILFFSLELMVLLGPLLTLKSGCFLGNFLEYLHTTD